MNATAIALNSAVNDAQPPPPELEPILFGVGVGCGVGDGVGVGGFPVVTVKTFMQALHGLAELPLRIVFPSFQSAGEGVPLVDAK